MAASLEDYRVELDYYAGPLDLLLHLVKKHEIDLHDIPIAKLTDQYLDNLEQMKQFDINVAADFLVMAATLLEIKSKMIAPPSELDEDDEAADTNALDEVDPRFELVKQLLEYKRFKDAANDLEHRLTDWTARFPLRPAKKTKDNVAQDGGVEGAADGEEDAESQAIEIDIEDVSVTDLCEAFARILDSIGQVKPVHAVTHDDTPISLHAEDIVDRLKREGGMKLQEIFVGRTTRSELIGLFLATLELVRQKRLIVKQNKSDGDIELSLRPESEQLHDIDDEDTDWRDPETGEMQYDWPDEASRQRFLDRKARSLKRMKGGFKGKGAKDDEDEEDAYIELDEVELELSKDPNVIEDTSEQASEEDSEVLDQVEEGDQGDS
jgi:segregation and condensation protein A